MGLQFLQLGTRGTLFTEMPGVQLLEEQHDQRALQKLLERIEALSQRFQSEAPPPVPEAARGQGLKGLKVQTLRSAKLDELEGQVQRFLGNRFDTVFALSWGDCFQWFCCSLVVHYMTMLF